MGKGRKDDMSETQELQEVRAEVQAVEQLAAVKIIDQASYQKAAETLKACKAITKKIESIFDPLIKAQNESLKAIRDEKKKHLEPVEAVESELRRATSGWIAEQERIRAEDERRKREAAAEEARRREEEARAGNDFLAEIGLAETVTPAPVVVEAAAPIDQAGISYREVWKFRITDPNAIPREYLAIDEAKIGQVVRAMKTLTAIPGVEAYSEKTAIVR
jgi:hypothetical protein